MADGYLSSSAAAQTLGISKCTLLRAVRRGDIVPAQRTPGGYMRFRAADVSAYAARLVPIRLKRARVRRTVSRAIGSAERHEHHTLQWLLDISRRLNKARLLDEVLDVVYDGVHDGLGFERVGVNLFDYEAGIFDDCIGTDARGRKLRPMDRHVELDEDSPIWHFPGIAALLRGADLYYTTDAFAECPPELRFLFDGEPRHNIMVPLHSGDAIIGMISVDNLLSGRPITREDAAPLLALAHQVGTAVERARAHARAENLARDAATQATELATIIDHIPSGIFVIDTAGYPVLANKALQRMRGGTLDPTRPISEQLGELAMRDPQTGDPSIPAESPIARALGGTPVQDVEFLYHAIGETEDRWSLTSAIPLRDADSAMTGVLVVRTDVTEQRRLMRDLAASQQRLRRVYESLSSGVVMLDRDGRIVDVNAAAQEMLGVPFGEMRGLVLSDSLWDVARFDGSESPLDERPAMVALRTGQPVHGEILRIKRPDGAYRWLQIDAVPFHDNGGAIEGLMLNCIDLTPRMQAEAALQHQARHDALTNLPNRIFLQDRLEYALRLGERSQSPLALLLIDLNRFKEVNDTLGHHCGDLLLREVGTRIQEVLRAADTVARLGGDEFAVLLPSADDVDALRIAERILFALDREFAIEGQCLDIGGSIGIALSPAHGADAATLLRCADVAMYVAKHAGGGYAVYDVAHDEHSLARLSLSRDLRQAIVHREFLLHYQPLVDLTHGQMRGVEALVRWRHPQRGLIPPDTFIPLAEQTGVIGPLTLWVLEEAIRQCGVWSKTGLGLDMAVNISMRTLHDPRLPDVVADLLTRYAVPPQQLTLEITESSLMADRDRVMATLIRLHHLGVRLAIDDFGTGYSSLAYLKQLPVDEIKIDKSFILGLHAGSTDEPLVCSILAMARVLGLDVVAEGVETRDACELLHALGCVLAQGYFMSRPLPAAELEAWACASPWGIARESA